MTTSRNRACSPNATAAMHEPAEFAKRLECFGLPKLWVWRWEEFREKRLDYGGRAATRPKPALRRSSGDGAFASGSGANEAGSGSRKDADSMRSIAVKIRVLGFCFPVVPKK